MFTSLKDSAQDHERFAKNLQELSEKEGKSGRSQAYEFLKRFQEHSKEIEAREEATLGLFEVADHLIQVDTRENAFDDGNRGLLFQIVHSLMEEAEEPTQVLENAISTGKSPYFAVYLLGLLSEEYDDNSGTKSSERERLLQSDDICKLREIWVNQIDNKASKGELADVDRKRLILKRWKEWGDSDDAVDWVREYTDDDDSLIELIEKFITEINVSPGGTNEILKLEHIAPFLDIEDVEYRLKTIDENELAERQGEVVEIFLKAQALEDPNSVESWHLN